MGRGLRAGSLRKKRGESGAWSVNGREKEKGGIILSDGIVDLIVFGLDYWRCGSTCFLCRSGSVGVGVDIHIVYTHTYYEYNYVETLQLLVRSYKFSDLGT